jgi:hypothetical protein
MLVGGKIQWLDARFWQGKGCRKSDSFFWLAANWHISFRTHMDAIKYWFDFQLNWMWNKEFHFYITQSTKICHDYGWQFVLNGYFYQRYNLNEYVAKTQMLVGHNDLKNFKGINEL